MLTDGDQLNSLLPALAVVGGVEGLNGAPAQGVGYHVDLIDGGNAAFVEGKLSDFRKVGNEQYPFPDTAGVEVADVLQVEMNTWTRDPRNFLLAEVLVDITGNGVMDGFLAFVDSDL